MFLTADRAHPGELIWASLTTCKRRQESQTGSKKINCDSPGASWRDKCRKAPISGETAASPVAPAGGWRRPQGDSWPRATNNGGHQRRPLGCEKSARARARPARHRRHEQRARSRRAPRPAPAVEPRATLDGHWLCHPPIVSPLVQPHLHQRPSRRRRSNTNSSRPNQTQDRQQQQQQLSLEQQQHQRY